MSYESSQSLFICSRLLYCVMKHHNINQVTIRTFDEITVYPTSDEEEHRAPQLIQPFVIRLVIIGMKPFPRK